MVDCNSIPSISLERNGYGNSISFWRDVWYGKPLILHLPANISIDDNILVGNLILYHQQWSFPDDFIKKEVVFYLLCANSIWIMKNLLFIYSSFAIMLLIFGDGWHQLWTCLFNSNLLKTFGACVRKVGLLSVLWWHKMLLLIFRMTSGMLETLSGLIISIFVGNHALLKSSLMSLSLLAILSSLLAHLCQN